ncbi:RNA-directed DNA polymerase, eukaryota [Tanacetum coccineum]|uniref:RNA-directed DNA polymerase, eukaryota n=1 Tax=Tanacetum coccineum TaxID=301880 RepID=A0ABQ4WSV9_9ASTR
MGPSVPCSSPKGGNEIFGSREKLCVILCLATFFHGWTIRIAIALSFPDNLLLFLFSTGVVIGGGVLNLPLSKAKISLGDFTLNELEVSNPVHESRDSHAFRSSFNMPTLGFESLHKVLCGFSLSLLDVVDFYRILNALLLSKKPLGRSSSDLQERGSYTTSMVGHIRMTYVNPVSLAVKERVSLLLDVSIQWQYEYSKTQNEMAKKDWIKELNNKHKVNFLSVQETKLDCISDMDVKVLWGNYKFEYTISEAVGNSGGILCVWDPSVFRKEHHVVSDNFVALYGSWVSNQAKLLVVSIYAPQSITSKRSLWSYISSLISRWDGHCMVMGDFNEVRCMEDRLGSVYNAQGANEFNSFISNSGLVEIQLEGYSFTWSLQSAKKMSVMVDGEWVDDPCRVKEEFRLHFANRSIPDMVVRKCCVGCGENKSSWDQTGLLLSFSNVLGHFRICFCAAVISFSIHSHFLEDGNSSFIALIPENHDPKFVNDFRQLADRESLQVGFLEDVLRAFVLVLNGAVIRGCLTLVWLRSPNGSPTSEFQFHCGLKQGDPLAPYLFILIMESLHLSLSRAIEAGIFKGIKIGSSLNISHLFYADDAVFIGEWSIANLSGITHILHCFSLLSGLSINLKKSYLFGVGSRSEVSKVFLQETIVFMLGIESTKMKLINARLKKINKPFVKSIKSPDGDIIDCVLFHLQPSFDNPKLKGAIMSLDPPDLPKGYDNTRVESEFKQIWSSNGESCPNGAIPIRRTSASEISRSISISEFAKRTRTKDIPPSSGHTAPNVTGNDYSISQILVIADAPNHGINTVFPSMYKDNLPRLFTFWTPDGYRSGCYNLECPGFVQTSSRASVGAAFSKDPKSGNWWLKVGSEDVGYWPQTLFTNLRDHATTIEYGEVYSENSGKHMPTPMGSGHLPDEGFGKAAFLVNAALTIILHLDGEVSSCPFGQGFKGVATVAVREVVELWEVDLGGWERGRDGGAGGFVGVGGEVRGRWGGVMMVDGGGGGVVEFGVWGWVGLVEVHMVWVPCRGVSVVWRCLRRCDDTVCYILGWVVLRGFRGVKTGPGY